ncbi:hypothetical protein OESDEN_12881 [Oesophagostomum dentatum]|uniref:G-protein coupled receptors family 1 profile domain-containing protein n=1 Tax=Oesophagostomum dentatum TaxID=61180 RepID=A0A0B1SUX8_OESDE|nr:hypothetical protein OESDEN_12881 [Oesophagostomum dentatum]
MNGYYPQNCEPKRALYDSLDRLREVGIIDAVNFTGCLPQCGICDHPLSNSDYIIYNIVVSGVILPLIGTFGLIGNGLSAFVYSRPEMRTSTNCYLCALGCSDNAVILTGIFLFFLDSVRKFSLNLTRIFGVSFLFSRAYYEQYVANLVIFAYCISYGYDGTDVFGVLHYFCWSRLFCSGERIEN